MSAVATSTVSTTENEYERFRMQKDLGVELIISIKKVLRNEDINFTQDLSNSFELVMNIKSVTSAVETSNPYANLVDKGMRPGKMVNFDALYDWVRIKIGLEEPELTSVTWAVIKKIHYTGIAPTHFAKKAIKMVIGKHGLAGTKRKYKKKSKSSGGMKNKRGRFAKFISKASKRVNKNVTKTSNLRKINKGLRQINKYGVRSINTMRKYK